MMGQAEQHWMICYIFNWQWDGWRMGMLERWDVLNSTEQCNLMYTRIMSNENICSTQWPHWMILHIAVLIFLGAHWTEVINQWLSYLLQEIWCQTKFPFASTLKCILEHLPQCQDDIPIPHPPHVLPLDIEIVRILTLKSSNFIPHSSPMVLKDCEMVSGSISLPQHLM